MVILELIVCKCKKHLNWLLVKIFPAEKFITHVLPLKDINKGIELTKSGEAIKVVLHPNLN